MAWKQTSTRIIRTPLSVPALLLVITVVAGCSRGSSETLTGAAVTGGTRSVPYGNVLSLSLDSQSGEVEAATASPYCSLIEANSTLLNFCGDRVCQG